MVADVREVALPTYRVTIGAGLLSGLGDIVREVAPAHHYALITDSNVGPLYGPAAMKAIGESRCVMLTIPAGESHKTRETWSALSDDLLLSGYGRDSTIIALGGGVVGDVAGFVAATYMRGIPYVQVPTSLLSMIDASVGGKTGVDTAAGKNLVGAFHQPAAVVADIGVLATLSPQHLRAGMAEAIKHGVIADADYFASVSEVAAHLSPAHVAGAAMLDLVARSVEIKADIVRRDEREHGVRKTLNFGHTVGHAVELCSEYRVLHGDAVAIGMVYESLLAERVGLAAPGLAARMRGVLLRARLPVALPSSMRGSDVVAATHSDKKARGGEVEYALPLRIGAMAAEELGWSIAVSDAVVREILA